MTTPPYEHFRGKSVPEHLKEARIKGAQAAAELHGLEVSGLKAACIDALRDTSMVAVFLHVQPLFPFSWIAVFLLAWILWKTCRSAILGWARLHKLHRVIEEEKWEIEHQREQEREELRELYQARGFSEPLLSQVTDTLMADDNRLLQVMLDEELGLPLESFEHPIKQASGAFLGGFIPAIVTLLLGMFFSSFVVIASLFCLFIGGGLIMTWLERGSLISSFAWNVAVFGLCLGSFYFLTHLT